MNHAQTQKVQAALGNHVLPMTRRYFLGKSMGISLGAMALQGMLADRTAAASAPAPAPAPAAATAPLFSPKVKRVIFLTQSGGPTQIELFDPKPQLQAWAGKELPDSVRKGQRLTGMTANQKQLVMPAKTRFLRNSINGTEIGHWLPHTASIAHELCVVRSMHTDYINHAPAMTFMLSGHQLAGRPSMGAWVSYGLGSDNRELPDYVVLVSRMQRPSDQPLYDHYWGSGFLPSRYQGVKFRNAKEPVLFLKDPDGMPSHLRKAMIDAVGQVNQAKLDATNDPEIATRIGQYEMAYRMQTSVPGLMDLSDEPPETFDLYGPESRRPGSYAANCILARRMAERGVRFIQLFHPDWDHHSRLESWCVARCRDTDQPSAALIKDLKQRGMLDDTLVIWGGEFGRGVAGQGDYTNAEAGRDHHPRCFSMWLAGGGIKTGTIYGATDDFSYNVVENPVHVHDLHATVMHLLGIDHTKLTYRFQGRDFRLTDVHGKVVKGILA